MDSLYAEDVGETNPWETRMFYELMQEYRWSRELKHTVQAFEKVKQFCREASDMASPLEWPAIDLGELR